MRRAGFLRVRAPVSPRQAVVSSVGIWVAFFGLWVLATELAWVNPLLIPPQGQVMQALYTLFAEQGFAGDVLISVTRVLVAFAMACAVAVPPGLAMGALPAIDAILTPFVSAWRYLPAPPFDPIPLMRFPCAGRSVVITGASRGIGPGIAQGFAAAGPRLHLIADDEAVRGVAAGLGATSAVANIADKAQGAAALSGLTRIDVLIDNAGLEVMSPIADASDATSDAFRRVTGSSPADAATGRMLRPARSSP